MKAYTCNIYLANCQFAKENYKYKLLQKVKEVAPWIKLSKERNGSRL